MSVFELLIQIPIEICFMVGSELCRKIRGALIPLISVCMCQRQHNQTTRVPHRQETHDNGIVYCLSFLYRDKIIRDIHCLYAHHLTYWCKLIMMNKHFIIYS